MTTTARTTPTTPTTRPPMDSLRRAALVVGVLFVITYITSIAAKFVFYPPLFDSAGYVVGEGADTRVLWGAVNEMILIIANIGTAVALYPVLRQRFRGLALGYVTARVMESVFIAVGVLSVVTIVSVRQDFAGVGGAEGAAVATVGHTLVALQEWTFALGPGVVVGVGNGLILGYMMYRSGLVPRGLAVLGLVGGPLLCLSGGLVILGIIESGSLWVGLATIPEFFWELGFGVYLIVKGFKPSPVTAHLVDAR